jgi:hypothetical protein
VEAIQFHLDRLGKTPKDLKSSRSRVWEILQRKRALTLTQIRALVRELGIPAERLIAEYKVSAALSGGPVERLLAGAPPRPCASTRVEQAGRTASNSASTEFA